jgi:hypothetical protein
LVENCEKGAQDRPVQPVVIARCGQIGVTEADGTEEADPDDPYPMFSEDFKGDQTVTGLIAASNKIRELYIISSITDSPPSTINWRRCSRVNVIGVTTISVRITGKSH